MLKLQQLRTLGGHNSDPHFTVFIEKEPKRTEAETGGRGWTANWVSADQGNSGSVPGEQAVVNNWEQNLGNMRQQLLCISEVDKGRAATRCSANSWGGRETMLCEWASTTVCKNIHWNRCGCRTMQQCKSSSIKTKWREICHKSETKMT